MTERIGERLRRRREELGFTIDDLAKVTRYRPEIIRAVEEGRAGVFPAEAYRQAFLRAYANKLGLDAAEIVREQKSEEERIQEALRGIRVRPGRSPGFRRGVVWLAVIAGAAVGLLLFYDKVIRMKDLPGPAEGTGSLRGAQAESAREEGSGSIGAPVSGDSAAPAARGEGGLAADQSRASAAEEQSGTVLTGSEPESEVTTGGQITASGDHRLEAVTDGQAEAEGVQEEPAGDAVPAPAAEVLDWVAVSVTGYAVRARLFAGDSLLVDGWLRSGFRDTFYSSQPFWADTIITHGDAMSIVLNGEKVDLPATPDNVITDFRISP